MEGETEMSHQSAEQVIIPPYANEAAFPRPRIERLTQQQRELTVLPDQFGLTKRELFAAMVAQGLLANGHKGGFFGAEGTAREAISIADALIKALEVMP